MPGSSSIAPLGLACQFCDKAQSVAHAPTPLLRCSSCRRVYYCSSDCQKNDWGRHKPLCKALKSLENDADLTAELIAPFPSSPQSDIAVLDRLSVSHKSQIMDLCEQFLGRPLNDDEVNMLSSEPRCLACTRTDLVLRTEARLSKSNARPRTLRPCPRCQMSFYCCDSHWDAARSSHEAPCEELPGGLSHCEINLQVRVDEEFRSVMTFSRLRANAWNFIPRQRSWTPLEGLAWDSTIGGDVRNSTVMAAMKEHIPASIRLVSSVATTAMTALYALEQLNIGSAWTNKTTLTIHILGGPPDFDPSIAYMYETILHRVPNVQILNIVFCSPALRALVTVPRIAKSVVKEVDACRACLPSGGTIFHHYVTKNYDDYVRSEGASFERPDLAIGTNCFLTTTDPELWRRTIKLLVARHIPSVFTAYDRRSAARDLDLIRESGANPIPSLTLVQNPWGAQTMHPNFDKVHGFHAPNAWFTGGFR
ncbi:hypothetical protein DFH06DRAFT_1179205 [Mycena polygramma]|nr:hypothetical protein DFH06DRAFT_1179205 [Mycena polygramma]